MSQLEPPAALSALEFLIGRFSGEGRFERGGTTFEKQVVGRWEAGGHFMALSMTAWYQVQDSIVDIHHAMAVVGVDPASGDIAARVFTDGGEMLEHRLWVEPGRILFPDRVPHEAPARRARKILRPTPDGYDETLEIDRGGDGFEPYSVVRLRRTSV